MTFRIAAMAIGLGALWSVPASAAVAPAPSSIPRPSAAINVSALGTIASGGQNLATSDVEQVRRRVADYREENSLPENAPVPVDAVTASSSGFDRHISVANAELQVLRVAEERGIPEEKVRRLVEENTDGRLFGFMGDPGVNVLELNLALDDLERG